MASTDVISLANAKDAMNISVDDHDVQIGRMIEAVSKLMDAECGPIVQRAVSAEIHDADYEPAIALRYRPVASIGTVRQAVSDEITTLTAATFGGTVDSYYAEPALNGGTLLSGIVGRRYLGVPGRWPRGSQVEVTYTAGRFASTAAVDARFVECAAEILRRLWKREAGSWAQSPSWYEDQETGADGPLTGQGFFKVAKPLIREMLWDEMRTRSVG